MLAGLNTLELGRLRMSVGYGTHKKGRPLSPIEVGKLLRNARSAGVSLKDCAKAINLNGTGHIGRFLRIVDLPEEIQHLVDWGSNKNSIGFSSAVELVRIKDPDDQNLVARYILTDGLNSKEVRQIAQLRMRSGRHIRDCIKEIFGMRTKIEKHYIFIGSVIDHDVEMILDGFTQAERDSIMKLILERLGLQGASGRLGKQFFTLAGDEHFDLSMKKIGKEKIEAQVRMLIAETIENGQSYC